MTKSSYIELHAHSYFSLLDGTSSPEALVHRAAELGMPALALTDHDALYGAVRFAEAARAHSVKPIFGAEMTLSEGSIVLLAREETGWHNLCQLITQARHNAPKGQALLSGFQGHTGGLIALAAPRIARHYRNQFDTLYVELQHHLLPGDGKQVSEAAAWANKAGLPVVATNDVHYATREGHKLHDALTAIRHNQTLDDCPHLRANSEYYLKPDWRMAALFAELPEALANTLNIAEQCAFDLRYGLQDLPRFPLPEGMTALDHLRQLCGPESDQLDHELDVIGRGGLANYFLIVWDIMRFAREQGIRCQGRGSAANSQVAYRLGISPIDPQQHNLVFERFLSNERRQTPDIDIDFDAARREEVIQYIYDTYGHAHTAMACTFVTYRARSAIRDVGKALGYPLAELNQLTKRIDYRDPESIEAVEDKQLLELAEQIRGLPRHLGIHNGGFVVMGPSLAERLPTEPATMDGRFVVQWDKDALETAGLVKIDVLGLRMLSAIDEALRIAGQEPDTGDPEVYAMIARADTVGVFQVESRAQATVQPQLKPDKFEDLVVSVALIRPGPIQGGMVHPYLRRREGTEPVTYPHPRLKPALQETLGVILFQEQVLKVARDLAGFTAGQGELLRRALGSKNAPQEIAKFHMKFIAGAVANGVSEYDAQTVFEKLQAFGGYSFAKSHAAAFAVLVYESAWLKRYHPAAFYTALLNNQPMGFWSPAVLVGDAQRHGVETLPVDVNRSRARCVVEDGTIRLGFNHVRGVGDEVALQIEQAQPYAGLSDFCHKTCLPRRLVENLIMAGGMDSWDERRALVWDLGRLRYREEELDLIFPPDHVDLPALAPAERMVFEQAMLGLSVGRHVMNYYRDWLTGFLNTEQVRECEAGEVVRFAGLIVVHQAPPTAKGVHFLTFEDEAGLMDVVVMPDVYPDYRDVLRGNPLVAVQGVVQRKGEVVNLLLQQAKTLPAM